MRLLLLLLFLSATSARAECAPACPPKPKTVVVTKTVQAPTPNQTATASGSAQSALTEGDHIQTVHLSVPASKPLILTRTIKRTVTKTRTKKVPVYVYRPSRLMLLAGQARTAFSYTETCCEIRIRQAYQPDIGLQYIRDFGRVSGSLAYTSVGSYYLGIGFNW
jgi:hypothetical protein